MIALLTPEAVAEQLGVEVQTLYNWRRTNQGPVGLKVGKYLRFEQEAVDAYVESLRPRSNVTPIRQKRPA